MNKTQKKIIQVLRDEGAVTISDISNLTHYSANTIRDRISELKKLGYRIDKNKIQGK